MRRLSPSTCILTGNKSHEGARLPANSSTHISITYQKARNRVEVCSLWRGDDDEVGDLALLDGSVRARPAEGVGGVDGGRRHRLRQAHPLVHARQVHHRRLQRTKLEIIYYKC